MSKKIFTWRVIILLIALAMMIVAINPNPFADDFEVAFVRGEAAQEGLQTGDIVNGVNGKSFSSVGEFNLLLEQESGVNATFVITTDSGEIAYITSEIPDIGIKGVDKSNVKLGLDLSGGTRVLLSPDTDEQIGGQQINDIIEILNNRLNTYGLGDLLIRDAEDSDGNKLILVEIAGATREEVEDLVGQQGVFEAKIGDEVVFRGSEKDVTFVCRNDGTCSGIRQCQQIDQQSYFCNFEFQIQLSAEAARRHAEITEDIPVNTSSLDSGSAYLAKPLDLYLDGQLFDSLQISEGLKGIETPSILISGSGNGFDESSAYDNALSEMNRLQTVLITGSLPFKLKIEKLDSISPMLGEDFIKNAFYVGFLSLLAVGIVIFIRYRKLKIVFPVLFTMASEVVIIIGMVALLGEFFAWRLDVVGIAGLIAAVGTGVDDQIVIIDEVLKGKERAYNWKERIKRAFFIIFAAYATTLAAMVPLINAGAGLIRGFALTIIFGITIGVFLTRPAFASLIEKLLVE